MRQTGKREREARKRRRSIRRTVITYKLYADDGSEEKRLKLGKRKLAEWERWRQHQGGGWTSYG